MTDRNAPSQTTVADVVAMLAPGEIVPDCEEIEILLAGGVTAKDFDYAIDRWLDAHRVRGDWGYIRTVALARRADVMRLQREVITRHD